MSKTAQDQSPAAELVEVDPGSLLIGINVRTDTHRDAKAFAASIKQRGVIEPITAYRDDAGSLVVLRGQRRSLVAAEVGTPSSTVPVRVIDQPDEPDRITDQLTENLHREAMGEAEVLAGVEQLALLGVSAAQITKRTALKRDHVDTALAVVGSAAARDHVDSGTLTLDQAAIFAEFDGDEDAQDRLTEVMGSGWSLAHTAQRIRNERAEAEQIRAEVERLRGEGLPVLNADEQPERLHDVMTCHLRDENGERIAEDQWPSIPGATQVVRMDWVSVEVTDDDGETYTDTERRAVGSWIVPDPAAAGLRHYFDLDRSPGESDDDAEARKEAERAERRRVKENNAAWRAAQTVRREWLAGFIKRKTSPTGAEALIVEAMLTHTYVLTKALDRRNPLLLELLGVQDRDRYGAGIDECQKYATGATSAKGHTMRALAVVLASWEASTDVHTWRNPSRWDARVLTALTGWGYEPSEVETAVATSHDQFDAA